MSSNLTKSTKFLKDLQKQNGLNAFFGVRMESKNGRQQRGLSRLVTGHFDFDSTISPLFHYPFNLIT